MLDDAGALRVATHHVASCVLQEDERRIGLVAKLYELRCLHGALGIDGAIVADDAHRLAIDRGLPAHGVHAVERLEVEEIAIVHQPRDHLAHVVGLAIVGRHHASELVGIVARLPCRLALHGRQPLVPRERRHNLARDPQGVGVVLGQILGDARHRRMHLRAAQFLVGRDLAGRSLQQRRAGQEDLGTPLYDDHVVAEPGQISAARRRGAVNHGHVRDAHGRHAREVGEVAPAVDEDLGLVVEIGAARLHQRDERQLVAQHDLLHAQVLAQAHGRRGAALDAGVACRDHAAHARDIADAGDHAATLDILRAVVVMHVETGESGYLEERRATVEHVGEPLARRELPALLEHRQLLVGGIAHATLQRAELLHQREHVTPVGLEGLRLRVDLARHERPISPPPAPSAVWRGGTLRRPEPVSRLGGMR